MDLSYCVVQEFFEVALSGPGAPTAAPNAGQSRSVEVTKTVNKTEYTHVSTTESHFEEYRRTRGSHVGESSSTYQGWGLQGLFVMSIFLACGFLLTFRWGGITTILVSEARTRPSRP
jgi:hypothetical protein